MIDKSVLYDVSYTVSADRERMLYAVIKEKVRCVYLPAVVAAFQGGGFCTTDKAKKLLINEQKNERSIFLKAGEGEICTCA